MPLSKCILRLYLIINCHITPYMKDKKQGFYRDPYFNM